ncbi:type VI secretion protein VasK, partial [Photorhabdus bodei]|nr:type VI secretion protein VasK [Photorhabdus bodei]
MSKAFITRNLGVGLITLLIALVSGGLLYLRGDQLGLNTPALKIVVWIVSMVGVIWLLNLIRDVKQGTPPQKVPNAFRGKALSSEEPSYFWALKSRARRRYGYFWRFKVRILLVTGKKALVEAIAPGLTTQHWLEGHRTLLLWGGSLHTEPDAAQLAALRRLRRFRPLNGIVWALTEQQSAQPVWMDKALRMLQKQAQQLHWQAPVYLWQVCHSLWSQAGRVTQAVGCFLPERCTPDRVETQLR